MTSLTTIASDTDSNHDDARRRAVKAWIKAYKEDMGARFRANAAAEQRRLYAEKKAGEGKTVRPYRHHDHGPARAESGEDREKRMHRNRQRTYRGVDPEHMRRRLDLSELSPDEKRAHERQLARERKRRQRLKEGTRQEAELEMAVSRLNGQDAQTGKQLLRPMF